jgi:hypothetical protein
LTLNLGCASCLLKPTLTVGALETTMLFTRSSLFTLSVVTLTGALSGCLASAPPEVPEPVAPVQVSPPLAAGTYQVQSIAYDDADGAYRVFLLDPPAGAKPLFVSLDLKMARLTDEEIAAGAKSARLVVDDTGPSAHLPPDFAIQYTHQVTEERNGQVVVVGQQTSTWSPFTSAMMGMAVGNMLFGPRYYYPPPYRGGAMTGFGGAGDTRQAAASHYTAQHGKAPQAARLAQSGYSKMPSSSLKSTGQGAGSSKLKTGPTTQRPRPKASFGRGFGRRR